MKYSWCGTLEVWKLSIYAWDHLLSVHPVQEDKLKDESFDVEVEIPRITSWTVHDQIRRGSAKAFSRLAVEERMSIRRADTGVIFSALPEMWFQVGHGRHVRGTDGTWFTSTWTLLLALMSDLTPKWFPWKVSRTHRQTTEVSPF